MHTTSVHRSVSRRSILHAAFFLCIFMVFPPVVFVEANRPFTSTDNSPTAGDSLSRLQQSSEQVVVPAKNGFGTAQQVRKPGLVAALKAPEGFTYHKLIRNQSVGELCAKDSLCQVLFKKINRIDRKIINAGKTVLLPVDTQKAVQYAPVPVQLTDGRGTREVRVFLSRQYFGAYEMGKLVFWGPVSSGKKTNATPAGKFFVNYKQRHKLSSKYENAPMPYSINYSGDYFIHQQSLPGYPASHGCVRLMMTDAERLFNWVRVHDAVTLVRDSL